MKKRLKNGEIILLTNEEFQTSIGDDDVRVARLNFKDGLPSWANGWTIEFNGELLHHSKTFKSFENRLKKLVEKWNLK